MIVPTQTILAQLYGILLCYKQLKTWFANGARCQKSNCHKFTTCLGVIIGHWQLKRVSAIFIDTRTLTQPVITVCFSRVVKGC